MKDDKKIYLGKITGVHGIKGWLKIQSFSSPPENILNYSQWIINNQGEEDFYSLEQGRKQKVFLREFQISCEDEALNALRDLIGLKHVWLSL